MADITMPQLGETVTEGTITKWFKAVGDSVAEDEPLFEVSTDKVDSEVPSPVSGTLTEIKVQEGDTVDVGVVLAVIGDGAPHPPRRPRRRRSRHPNPSPPQRHPNRSRPQRRPPRSPHRAAPAAAPTRRRHRRRPPNRARTGLRRRHRPAPARSCRRWFAAWSRSTASTRTRSRAPESAVGSPATTSWPRPRDGVLPRLPPPNPPAAPAAAPAPDRRPLRPRLHPADRAARRTRQPSVPEPLARSGDRDTVIPHTNIRKRTAEHMRRSLDTSAHVYASIEVDYEGVEQVRRANKDQWRAEEGFGLTYLPFISRAVVDALHEFPEANATFTDEALVVHNYVNLGIAVDLDFKGLMVPVIRDADGKRMRAIARDISDLAARARSKKLTPDDISNGTFTITNPGPFGTLLTMPVINQPQVAILSTDGVKRKPVVVDLPDGTESIAIHSVGNLALTWDHRAFDGAYAAAFLHKIKELLETRDWSAEL